MRFLVDESTGPAAAEWLCQKGHEVFSVYDEARGMADEDIIQKAFIENWILMTNDKDFGEKVYREKRPHKGIVLLRLEDERALMNLIVAKNFSKIFFVSFNSGSRNAFPRWQLDLTFGDFCPPTLTLPLGGGREGWG